MSVTLNIKADVAGTLVWEDKRFRELSETSNRTTGTFYDETSDTSSIQYTGNDGQQGFLDKVYATLQASKNPLIASDWNTFQSESKTSFDALETPTYSSVSATGLRDLVLSGNKNGALTQTMSGESAINLLGDLGGFYKDSNNDGLADNLTSTTATALSVSGGVQSFTATAINGRVDIPVQTTVIGHKYYFRGVLKSTSNQVYLGSNGLSPNVMHSGSGLDEMLSTVVTAIATSVTFRAAVDGRASTWDEIQIKEVMYIDLTDEGDAALSISELDLKYAKYFDNIGHATINQKMIGANGEFELKEPYVLPKTKDGTETTLVVKDDQNFIRPAHKKNILDGSSINWTGFATSGSVITAYVDNLSEEEFLSLTLNSGDFVNNDFNFRMSTSISTTDNSATYNVTNSRLTLGILQSLAGTTQSTYEAYLNNNPVESSIALALAEYNTGLLDIPIKHLASSEGGTFENNSTILPSALTLTYPTNEAAERESSQIAQNQITTVNDFISGENVKSIYQNGLLINEQGEYSQTITNIYENGLLTLEFDNTSKIVSTYENGLLVNEAEVEL